MEFKTTSTRVQSPKSKVQSPKPDSGLQPSNFRLKRRAGFTLVEVMIATGLSGLVLAVCLSLALFTSRSIASVTDSVDLNARSRHAIDRMGQKLRQASDVKSISPSSVTVVFNGRSLSYKYDGRNKRLTEIDGSTTTILLEDCETLAFNFYQRNPQTNSFNQFPFATATDQLKVIQVNWRCQRTLVGNTAGSAEMVSARFVIRAN